jgi:hypothetical protein
MPYFEWKAGGDCVVMSYFESISVPQMYPSCTVANVLKALLPMKSTNRSLPKMSSVLYATSQRSTVVPEPSKVILPLVLFDAVSTGAGISVT